MRAYTVVGQLTPSEEIEIISVEIEVGWDALPDEPSDG